MKTNDTKFTPGPWKCQHTGDRKHYVIGAGQSLFGTHVAEVYSDDTDTDEAAANAALIQHAPDLLAALVALIEAEEASKQRFDVGEVIALEAAMQTARAALQKALSRPSNVPDQPRP